MGRLVTVSEAQGVRERLRRQAKTVVFTNGIFDLLHVGHVHYLQAARELGHALFVGLNSDSSTRKLKGPGRPLIPQGERAQVLCALACVDYVVIFDEPTAEHLVERLRPDVYAKGGDYADVARTGQAGAAQETRKPLPEARVVERYGGHVVLLPYTIGHSTTQIMQRILNEGEPNLGG